MCAWRSLSDTECGLLEGLWGCLSFAHADIHIGMKTLYFMWEYAWGQDRERKNGCHMWGNAATDHFYHIILWARVCKCVTCLCFSGCVPVLAKRMMKWSQMVKEQNSFLLRKQMKEVGEKNPSKECQAKSQESASFHTIVILIPPRRKREVTLQ